METSEHREREHNVADEIWMLVTRFFEDLKMECRSIRYNIKEIHDFHLGNVRLSISNSRRCFNDIDGIKTNRRKLAPLRRELQTLTTLINNCYEPTLNMLAEILLQGKTMSVVQRIEDVNRKLETDESHPWITIINGIANSNSPHDIETIDGFKTIFESLGKGLRDGSRESCPKIAELAAMVHSQKDALKRFAPKFKDVMESYTESDNPLLDPNTKNHLQSDIESLFGLMGGYFSMMEAIIYNIFRAFEKITILIDDHSKRFIQKLEEIKQKKLQERGGRQSA